MKALYAEFTSRPGSEHRLGALVAQLTQDVRAEVGNVRFDAFVRSEDARQYVVFEVYQDEEAFQAHLASAHCHVFNEQIAALVEGSGSTLHGLEAAA